MSVSGADPVHDKLEPIALPISDQDNATLAHEQPADVSIPSDKPFSGSALGNSLALPKEDASNGDVSGNAEPSALNSAADPQVAANGHPPTADAVPEAITAHSKEIVGPEHVSGDTTDSLETLLGAVATASESVGAENLADAAVAAENVSVKEPHNADIVDYATTAEPQESSTSDSVTVLPEESLADKIINDSAIEISPPALEKKEEEEDHGVADKPDVEAVEPAIGGESAVVVEDAPEEMSHTQVDGTHVEEAEKVVPTESEGAVIAETDPLPQEESHAVLATEAQELPKAPADEEAGAAEQVKIDQVIEGQPPAEATTDAPVAEVNEPDGGSGAVGGVGQEETAHEAAAEINNGTHEAVVADDEPKATVAVEETNGNEATLEQLDEQPEVTVHVEAAPFVEEPQTDEVAVATVVDEPAGEGVPASVEDKADAEQAGEDVRGEVVGKDIPAVVEAVPVNEAVVEESQASVVSEEAPAVEAVVEEIPASVDVEPVVEIASKDTLARVEAGPEVAIKATPDPVEHDSTIHEEVASAPVEAEVASEESSASLTSQVEVAIEETSVSVEGKPVVEAAREETAVAESAVKENTAPGEPIVEVTATEETPAQGEAEPAVGVTTTEEAPAPVEAEPVVSEVSPAVVEAEPTDEVATTEETAAPIEAESTDEVTTNEETSEAEPVVSEESLVVVEAESTVEVANTEAILASGGAEPVVAEETPVAVEAAPVYSEETLAPVEAEHVVSDETAVAVEAEPTAREALLTDSKPTTDISQEVPAPVEAELIASETTTVDTEPVAEVSEDATPVVTKPSAEVASQDVPALVEAISTPQTVSEETSTAANEVVPESEMTSAPIEASGVAETELDTIEIAQEDVPAQAVEIEPALGFEADNTPVGVAQEEVAVQGAPAAVNSLDDTHVQVADAEPEITVEPMLKEQGVFEAGIKNDTEVALEDASVALATNSVEEEEASPPAVSSESTKEPNVGAVLEEQPATESGHLSADVLEPSIKEDVPAEEPVEDAVRAEPLTGLKTEDLYIQTSVDTTTFTPIVDSGIDLKEPESQPSRLLSIAEEIERPKSPWSSFQVTTIGRGELPEEEDVQSGSKVVGLAETAATASLVLAVEHVATKQEALVTTVVSVDPVDSQPLEPDAELWTHSYSVHSQGTLTQASMEPTEDDHVVDKHYVDKVIAPAETKPQDEPDVNAVDESETQVEEGNEAVSEATIVQENSVKSASDNATEENLEVMSADVTEPQTEETVATTPVITLGDQDIDQAVEDEHGAIDTAVTLPILSISTESIKSTVLEAPAEPWTPSYSVHSQGSPSITPAELDGATAESEPIADKQPWTPSYSVHAQGSPLVSAKEIDEASEPETPEPPAGSWTPSYSIHSQGTPLVTPKDLEETSALDVEPLEASAVVESTDSAAFQDPWTSSVASKEISVAEVVHDSQNDDSVHTATDEQVGKNMEAAVVVPVIAIAAVEAAVQTIAGIDVTSSVNKTTLPVLSVSIDEAALNSEPNHTTSDVPERPWTPSYSVTQQGPGLSHQDEDKAESQPVGKASVSNDSEPQLNEVQEANAVQLRPGYNVVATEDMARDEKFMLFGLRAIVAYLWVLPNWLSVTRSSSESKHSRQNSSSSSSSSKFFPGGWFTPKANEGRASLDIAQGEFTPSVKVMTTTDVFETLNVENEAGASTRTMTAGDGADGQKRKWCIVM